MLAGRRVFGGDSVTDTLAKVIEREPDWTALPADTPAHVRGVLERCLRKDPSRRLRDIGDARLQLEEGPNGPAAPPLAPAPRAGWRLPIAVAAALVAGIAVGWLGRSQPTAMADAARSTQLDLLIPTGFELFTLSSAKLAMAPDGSKVAYVAGGAGSRQVFVRALDEPASVPLRGTDAAFSLAFAPDGQSLVFLSRDRTLKRLSLRDGLVSDIATASGTNAPLWGVDGAIVFGRDGLWRVPAPGASPTRLTNLDTSRGEMAHTTGDVLPSGVVLFTSWVTGDRSLGNNEGDTSRIEAVNPADGVRRIVVGRASAPMYAATGHLLFLRDDAIMAVPFDARTAEVTGDAVSVIPAGVVRLSGGLPLIGLSTNGTLVYAPSQTGLVNLVRVNSDGRTERLSATSRAYTQPRVAPDGTRVVLAQGADSLWLHDLSRDARTPLTPGRLPGVSFPIWSRDGRRVVYRRFDDLWWVDADGSGRSGRVPASAPGDIPATLALDGDTLAVLRTSQGTGGDIFVLSLSGAWPPRPLVQTPGYDGGADISPDGRWLLFASTDSGPSQVYLSPYPAMDRKWPVSTSGGTQPRWSHDGRQVFYRDGNRMMAVAVNTGTGAVRLSAPRMLFEREFASGGYITIANYDVLPDGSFVMTEAEPGSPRLTVVLNWFDVLKRKLASSAVR